MPLKFDQLPDVVLIEIFKLVNPAELFNFRLLNKCLSEIVNHVIKFNLVHSIYNQYEFSEYSYYQEEYIKRNGPFMKHVSVTDLTIENLNYCPNLVSVEYAYLLSNRSDNHTNNVNINSSDSEVNIELPKLKKISIQSPNCIESLNIFSKYLNQIEVVHIITSRMVIKDVIKYFDPAKLRSCTLFSNEFLNVDGLNSIKIDFDKLRKLYLRAGEIVTAPARFDCNLNFNPSLNFEIVGDLSLFNIDYLGDLKRLKSIRVIDYTGSIYIMGNNNIGLFEGSNTITLGHFNLDYLIDSDFMKLAALKEIYIKVVSVQLLRVISLLKNIHKIEFDIPYESIKTYISYIDNYPIKCEHIRQVKMKEFNGSFETFIYFLSLFPNLEVVKLTSCLFISTNNQFGYELTTPLLIIAPIDPNELNNNPMIDWFFSK